MDNDRVNQDVVSQGITLCLSCGMCCNGALHGQARIAPQEIYFAESLGLTILEEIEKEVKVSFRLPCPRWQDGRCSVYPIRPNVCGDYRCKLLRSLHENEMELDTAQYFVTEVKALVSEIEELIGDWDATASIWQRVLRFAEKNGLDYDSSEFSKAFQTVRLKVASLDWLLTRYFLREEAQEPKGATST
jgi:uncharacterized protein